MLLNKLLLHLTVSTILIIDCTKVTLTGNSIVSDNKTRNDLLKLKATKLTTNRTSTVRDLSTFCQSFQSCSECVNNLMHPCYWCHNYGCTNKADVLCPETLITINKTHLNTNLQCPFIKHEGEILVPAGMRTNLKVNLHALDPEIYDKEIICQIHFKQSLTHLKGLIMNNVIYCYPVILETGDHGETNTGYMKIIWGGIQPISNGIPVSVYNCENLADDCHSCILIPVQYGCGWCDKIKKCVIADKCGNNLIKWSLNRLECTYARQLIYV